MSNVITAEFRVVKRFSIDDGIGYLIVKCDDEKMPYFLVFEKDIEARKVDEQFNIELPIRAGRVTYAAWMIPIWDSEVDRQADTNADKLASIYLMYLYLGALQANRPNAPKMKTFDKETVFATLELRIVEELYKILTKKKLRDELAKTNFHYHRRSVYTRFDGDGAEISYHTPRRLDYYPDDQIVTAAFHLVGSKDKIVPPSGRDYGGMIPQSHTHSVVVRTTIGEGWLSLRDYMKIDPKIDAYVRHFYNEGHGVAKDVTKRK